MVVFNLKYIGRKDGALFWNKKKSELQDEFPAGGGRGVLF
jgi:hypothetical protein